MPIDDRKVDHAWMLVCEAEWLGRRMAAVSGDDLFPLVNVGSSTEEFRSRTQPYIDELVFAPLRARGGRVCHVDLKAAPGVDIVGDLLDPATHARISGLSPRSFLVSNLFEHVTDRGALARALLDLTPSGGYIFISGPHVYPYHADPIDTLFRPTAREMADHFPGTEIIESAILDGGDFRNWNSRERGGSLPRMLIRLLVPLYRPRRWLEVARRTPYLFKHIRAFSVILRKVN